MVFPTLVLVPGAWHTPKCFRTIIKSLESHGHKCITVHMPSVGRDSSPVTSLDEDMAVIRSVVLGEIEAGKDVVVVSHSWSGVPVGGALMGLGKKQRKEKGEENGVLRIAYIAAFVPPVGVSLLDAVGGNPPDWWHIEGNLSIVNNPSVFYNDLPEDQIKYWSGQLQSHSLATKKSKATGAAYLETPCSYLYCEQDQAIPIFAQEAMVGAAREGGAEFETVKLNASHSPFLSQPDRVVEYIRRAAGEKVEVAV